MEQELIDFLKWHRKGFNTYNKLSIKNVVKRYLKSIDEHPIECRNISENKQSKEDCFNYGVFSRCHNDGCQGCNSYKETI